MSEKTHQPTPRRLREARKKGEVARSPELTRTLVLIGMLVWLGFGAASLAQHLMVMLKESITRPVEAQGMGAATWALLEPHLLPLFLPPLLFMAVFSVAGDFLQVRGNLSFHPLLPQLERINPAAGFARMFSAKNMVNLGFSLVKMMLTLGVAWLVFSSSLRGLTSLTSRSSLEIMSFVGSVLLKLLMFGAGIQILGAVLDFAYQQYDYLKRMRMSIEELRREHKETEGDPHIRARRRALARAQAFEP